MTETETPIEEWRQSRPDKKGNVYEYVVLKGPGGGIIRRQGGETPDEARVRAAVAQEAKRRDQREQAAPKRGPGRPKGKGRAPDKPPVPPAPDVDKPKKGKPSKEQLAAAAELPFAVLGAFIGRGVLGCDYCAGAMQSAAPAAAKDLAKSQNPYVVNLLVWWHGLISSAAGAEGIALFAGVPIIHHLAPQPMYEFVAPFMGMPARAPKLPHQHGAGPHPQPEAPSSGPPPPVTPPAGGGNGGPAPLAINPQVADLIGRTPGLFEAYRAGDPRARSYIAELIEQQAQQAQQAQPVQSPPVEAQPERTAEEYAAERDALIAEAARLRQVSDMAAREQARQANMPTGNIPGYRAPDTLNPSQLRQMREAEASRQMPGGLPNYNGGESAPGTPSAPAADSAQSAGSPLPPEAEAQ